MFIAAATPSERAPAERDVLPSVATFGSAGAALKFGRVYKHQVPPGPKQINQATHYYPTRRVFAGWESNPNLCILGQNFGSTCAQKIQPRAIYRGKCGYSPIRSEHLAAE